VSQSEGAESLGGTPSMAFCAPHFAFGYLRGNHRPRPAGVHHRADIGDLVANVIKVENDWVPLTAVNAWVVA
jgi:hypothetical protein